MVSSFVTLVSGLQCCRIFLKFVKVVVKAAPPRCRTLAAVCSSLSRFHVKAHRNYVTGGRPSFKTSNFLSQQQHCLTVFPMPKLRCCTRDCAILPCALRGRYSHFKTSPLFRKLGVVFLARLSVFSLAANTADPF